MNRENEPRRGGGLLCEDELRRAQAAFQGRIVAGATHELQNHLAVIKEYNGLVCDLLSPRKPEQASVRRCVEVCVTIDERAQRAAAFVEVLNRFAHRGDAAPVPFAVDRAVEELCILLQRKAQHSHVSLAFAPGCPGLRINNDPLLMQFALDLLMEPLIDAVAAAGRLALGLETRPDATGAALILIADGDGKPEEPEEDRDILAYRQAILDESLSCLAASLSVGSTAAGARRLSLSVPSL